MVDAGDRRRRRAIRTRERRSRNQDRGLCLCGRPTAIHPLTGRKRKTCESCYVPVTARKLRRVSMPPPRRRAFTRLESDHDAATLAEWQAFADAYDMPLWAAIEAGMELLIAITTQAERSDTTDPIHAAFLQVAS
jgi:hypothetical protein